MEIVRVEMDLRRLRHNDGESEERKSQREQIEVLKLEFNSSNSHLVALKYEVSKTQVSRGVVIDLVANRIISFLKFRVTPSVYSEAATSSSKRRTLCILCQSNWNLNARVVKEKA